MAKPIVLTTLNARYTHASLGLRYLRANLGAYRDQSVLAEFTIKQDPAVVVDTLLQFQPRVVGFGIYIWNTRQTEAVIRELRRRAPDVTVVCGGPEVSFETEEQVFYQLADYIICGEADQSFARLIDQLLGDGGGEQAGSPAASNKARVIRGPLPEVGELVLPYQEYNEHDLKHRRIYVEASRGCPYKCEYCLSALDKSVRNFDLQQFLAEMQSLLDRGAREFRFVDRTFNLSAATSGAILQFFLDRIDLGLFLHFELVPDRLPDGLKKLIEQFPAGSLQFEIGVQTFDVTVAANTSRRQNYMKVQENFEYLCEHTGVHTHADLIVGLPGETAASFERGFNTLWSYRPDEIQVGILKRLRGAAIIAREQGFDLRFSSEPPYTVLSTSTMSAGEIEQFTHFAAFYNSLVNSGKLPLFRTMILNLLPADGAFRFLFDLSQRLYAHFGRTHSIQLLTLLDAVRDALAGTEIDAEVVADWYTNERAGVTRYRHRAGGQADGQMQAHLLPERQQRHLKN